MRVLPGSEINGVKASDAKKICRLQGHRDKFATPEAGWELRIAEPHSSRTMKSLSDAGLLEFAGTEDYVDYWRVTELGARLAASRIAKPITRQRADTILKQVIARAREVNSDDKYAYRISALHVFGSWVGKSKELGDIDIAPVLDLRKQEGRSFREDAIRRAHEEGRSFQTWFDETCWPEREVKRRLKVNPAVSLHDNDELERLGAPYRTVYAFDVQSGLEIEAPVGIRKAKAGHHLHTKEEMLEKYGVAKSRAIDSPASVPEKSVFPLLRPLHVVAPDRDGFPLSEDDLWAQHRHANGETLESMAMRSNEHSVRTMGDLVAYAYDVTQGTTDRFEPGPGAEILEDGSWRSAENGRYYDKDGDPKYWCWRGFNLGEEHHFDFLRRIPPLSSIIASEVRKLGEPAYVSLSMKSPDRGPKGWDLSVSIYEDDRRTELAWVRVSDFSGGAIEASGIDAAAATAAFRVAEKAWNWGRGVRSNLQGASFSVHSGVGTDDVGRISKERVSCSSTSLRPLCSATLDKMQEDPRPLRFVSPGSTGFLRFGVSERGEAECFMVSGRDYSSRRIGPYTTVTRSLQPAVNDAAEALKVLVGPMDSLTVDIPMMSEPAPPRQERRQRADGSCR